MAKGDLLRIGIRAGMILLYISYIEKNQEKNEAIEGFFLKVKKLRADQGRVGAS